MIHETLFSIISLVITMTLIGFVFGLIYFSALERTVSLYTAGLSGIVIIVLTLGRIGAATIFLGISAMLGITSLLGSFVGFLIARTVTLRATRGYG